MHKERVDFPPWTNITNSTSESRNFQPPPFHALSSDTRTKVVYTKSCAINTINKQKKKDKASLDLPPAAWKISIPLGKYPQIFTHNCSLECLVHAKCHIGEILENTHLV